MADIYVIALVGDSPGVVTELLWHLAVRERHRITGCELWTTDDSFRERFATGGVGMIRQLRGQVPGLPQIATRPTPIDDVGVPPGAEIAVFLPTVAGRPVADLTSIEDASAWSAALHRRLAVLRGTAGVPTQLVGSLAGGRKSMSAGLHSAFALYARASDRLCHVLLDGTVEHHLRTAGKLTDFAFPTDPILEIPPEEQIVIVDVPFFPASELLTRTPRLPASHLLARARRELEGLRENATLSVQVTKASSKAKVSLGRSFTMDPKTILAFGILIHSPPMSESALKAAANAAMRERGSSGTSYTEFRGKGFERNLRNLASKIRKAVDIGSPFATLEPFCDDNLSWRVELDPVVDVSALVPARLLDVLFPIGKPRRATARTRES